MDATISGAIEFAWETGEGRNLIGNLLSGLEHHCTFLKGSLEQSWRLWRVWGKYSAPCRAPPFTVETVMAIAYYMWSWGFKEAAVLTCLGFSCFLRSMEFIGFQGQQLSFAPGGRRCHISLPRTKGTSRSGGVEGVTVDDPVLVRLLQMITAGKLPGDSVMALTPAHYRIVFKAAVQAVGLPHTFQPYSLRRGGATWHFRLHGNIGVTMEIGRWTNMSTCRT